MSGWSSGAADISVVVLSSLPLFWLSGQATLCKILPMLISPGDSHSQPGWSLGSQDIGSTQEPSIVGDAGKLCASDEPMGSLFKSGLLHRLKWCKEAEPIV